MFGRDYIRYSALCAAAALCLGAAPTGQGLPYQLSGDVSESYRLLTTTYYEPVDPHAILTAAGAALVDAAHKRGVTIAQPALRVQSDRDATVAGLDMAIAAAAHAAHASQSEFAYAAIAGMAKGVNDRYTQFFTPDELKQFNEALDPARIGGIGVMIQPDQASGFVHVTYVVPGTPAERAGVEVGDAITAVNGTSTKGLAVNGVSQLLRGVPGTNVAVSVTRAGFASALSITRENVQPPTVIFRMLSDGIGYVWVMAFGRATPGEFDTAISRLNAQGAKALVLDLRNDGGGYVNSALDISSRFIANKALLTVEQRGQPRSTIQSRQRSVDRAPGLGARESVHGLGFGDYCRCAAGRWRRNAGWREDVRQRRDADALAASRRRRDQDYDGALPHPEPPRHQPARDRSRRAHRREPRRPVWGGRNRRPAARRNRGASKEDRDDDEELGSLVQFAVERLLNPLRSNAGAPDQRSSRCE